MLVGPPAPQNCLSSPEGVANARSHSCLKGCTYSDRGPDQGFPSGPVRLVRNPEIVRRLMDPSCNPGGETWGSVWPDNVHETGVSPSGQSRSPIMAAEPTGRANSKKDLVTGPIRDFCALHAPHGSWLHRKLSGRRSGLDPRVLNRRRPSRATRHPHWAPAPTKGVGPQPERIGSGPDPISAPFRPRRRGAGRASSKKELLTGRIRVSVPFTSPGGSS